MDERALRTALAGRLQQIQGPDRVRVEVVERDRRGPVVGRLRRGVHDDRGLQLLHERQDAGAVSHVQFVVNEASNLPFESALVPARVALRTEEHRPLVVVQSVDLIPLVSEVRTDLAADQAGRSGYKHQLHLSSLRAWHTPLNPEWLVSITRVSARRVRVGANGAHAAVPPLPGRPRRNRQNSGGSLSTLGRFVRPALTHYRKRAVSRGTRCARRLTW